MLLFFLFLTALLFCHGACEDADIEAKFLMILLKNSIDLQQLEALSGFISKDFTWDACNRVYDFDGYVEMLKMMSTYTSGMPPMSTDWSVTDAHFNDARLFFKIHFNNQKYAYYPDWQFEAGKTGANEKYMIIRGKSARCGPLEPKELSLSFY